MLKFNFVTDIKLYTGPEMFLMPSDLGQHNVNNINILDFLYSSVL